MRKKCLAHTEKCTHGRPLLFGQSLPIDCHRKWLGDESGGGGGGWVVYASSCWEKESLENERVEDTHIHAHAHIRTRRLDTKQSALIESECRDSAREGPEIKHAASNQWSVD